MHIKDTLLEKFGSFTLDMEKISTTSVNKYEVVLPYTGILPACITGIESVAIKIMVTVQLQYLRPWVASYVCGSVTPKRG